jgi:AcrR family transcriptional regulator
MPRKSIDKTIILETATQLADADGLEQVTLAALAQRLGIKTPSLYNHIDGMNGLRKELALYGIRKLNEEITQASVGKAGDKALLSMGTAYVSFVRKHPGLYEATLPSSVDLDVQAAGNTLIMLLLRVLEEYNLEEEDALHIVRGFRSLVHGFASLEHKGGFGLSLDRDESLRRLLETYLQGLHKE